MMTVVVVVVNFIKHQNRAITGERVAARAAPSYQYAMVWYGIVWSGGG